MKDATRREKLGNLLQTNKLVILLEIVIVFFPLALGVMISENTGNDQLALGGNVVLIQGPMAFLGLIISLSRSKFRAVAPLEPQCGGHSHIVAAMRE